MSPSSPRASLLAAGLLLALGSSGGAAVRIPLDGAPLFPPVGPAWTAALGLTPDAAAPLAPVVAELEGSLELDPGRFAGLPAPEREAALSLAREAAGAALEERAYELARLVRVQLAAQELSDRPARARLFHLLSRVRELRDRYAGLLPEGEAGRELAWAHAQASGRAAEVRRALLEGKGPRPAGDAPAALPPLKPSSAARKMLDTFKNSPWGRRTSDVHTVYAGYGFEQRNEGGHRVYFHPLFPHIRDNVPTQNGAISPNYVMMAVKNVRKLEELHEAAGRTAEAEPPAEELPLEGLRELLLGPEAPAPAAAPEPEAAPRRSSRPEAKGGPEDKPRPSRRPRKAAAPPALQGPWSPAEGAAAAPAPQASVPEPARPAPAPVAAQAEILPPEAATPAPATKEWWRRAFEFLTRRRG